MTGIPQASPALLAAQDAAFAREMTDADRQHLLLNLVGALLAAGWEVSSVADPEGDVITVKLRNTW